MKWLVTAVHMNRRTRKREGKGKQVVFETGQIHPRHVELEYESMHSERSTVCKVVDVRLADGQEVASGA